MFAGKQGYITLRDLFRWGERYRHTAATITDTFYDWDQLIADQGTLFLNAANQGETFTQPTRAPHLYHRPGYVTLMLDCYKQNRGYHWSGVIVELVHVHVMVIE